MSDREESTIKVLAMFNDSKALHVKLICRIPKLPILLLLTFKEINLRNILSSVSKDDVQRADVVGDNENKCTAVSNIVWVCLKGMLTEKILKEK